MRVYTTLEGQINFRRRLPIDNLGNPVLYIGVQFLAPHKGLLHLNRYMAACFLEAPYDERCYTLDVDTVMLREALADFHGCLKCRNIMARPFRRALTWLEAQQNNEQRLLSYSVT